MAMVPEDPMTAPRVFLSGFVALLVMRTLPFLLGRMVD